MFIRPVALCGALCLAAVPALLLAASPESGTLTPGSPELSYTFPATTDINLSGGSQENDGYTCDDANPCDVFELTVDLPADYTAAHPNDQIHVVMRTTTTATDIDGQVLDDEGHYTVTRDNPPDQPDIFLPVRNGRHVYQVQVVPGAPHEGGGVTVRLVAGEFTEPPPPQQAATGIAPRFVNYTSPVGLGDSAGEPSLGFNPFTKKVMYIAGTETDRVTFPELLEPALPMACEAQWEDVTDPASSATTVDPIIHVEQTTGRTFVSHNFFGPNALFAYTDDDGESWVSASAAPPNGGADHQTVGAGPYPAAFQLGLTADYAVYFCSQATASAFCSRSDTGGATFGPGVPIRTPEDCTDTSAIHGHVQIAPDGTVYVPNRICERPDGTRRQTISVSEDAGQTWVVRDIHDAPAAQKDPAVGVASDGTLYACYEAGDHSAHAVVSRDKGATWENDYNISVAHNLKTTRFVTVVAGDPDRAACAFIGTPTEGNSESLDFPGFWYGYVATTYDGGATWHTVNVTPNDPVQGAGGVCVSGIACSGTPNNRNLLDFNDVVMTDRGQVLFSYADGCIGDCVINPALNSFTDNGVIARQTGGRGLLAAFDEAEPKLPRNACLEGFRTPSRSVLSWRAPDHGGEPITGYDIYRSTAPGETGDLVGSSSTTSFVDTAVDAAVEKYYYTVTATNAVGTGSASNVIELVAGPEPVIESACTLPGITVVSDGAGDAQSMQDFYDILSMHVAEPLDQPQNLVFTLKVASLATLPPNSLWAYRFHAPVAPDNGDVDYFVGMHTEGGAPTYVWGTVGVADGVATSAAVYTIQGEIDPASGWSEDGTITLIAPRTLFGGINVGDALSQIIGTTRPISNASGPITAGGQDTAEGGSYIVQGAVCVTPPTVPGGLADGTVPTVTDNDRYGGALGAALLLMLAGGALLRRAAADNEAFAAARDAMLRAAAEGAGRHGRVELLTK